MIHAGNFVAKRNNIVAQLWCTAGCNGMPHAGTRGNFVAQLWRTASCDHMPDDCDFVASRGNFVTHLCCIAKLSARQNCELCVVATTLQQTWLDRAAWEPAYDISDVISGNVT